jgi:hypothetical protein
MATEIRNFNAVPFTGKGEHYALLTGDLKVHMPEVASIELPPIVTHDCHIVIPKDIDNAMFVELARSPILNNPQNKIYFYDQDGNCFGRLEKERVNNKIGDLRVSINNKSLIRNIKYPNIPLGEGFVYIVLDRYIGAELCKTQSIQNNFLNQDFNGLVIPNNVYFIVTPHVRSLIDPFVPNLITFEHHSFATQISEYFFGKKISDMHYTYQNILELPNTFECLTAICSSGDIRLTARSRGRIQINTSGKNPNGEFMLIAKYKPEAGVVPVLKDTSNDTTFNPNVTVDEKLHTYLNSKFGAVYAFYSNLKKIDMNNEDIVKKFLMDNSQDVISCMFDAPLKMDSIIVIPKSFNDFIGTLSESVYLDLSRFMKNPSYSTSYMLPRGDHRGPFGLQAQVSGASFL